MPSSSVLPRKQMRTPSRPSLGVRVRSPARYPAGRRYHFIIATRSCAPWHRVTNLPVNQELEWEEYENTLRARARKWLSRRGGRHRCWPSIDYTSVALWDAENHIGARLAANFGEEEAPWHIGGPVWRERRVKEESARRFPDAPWHQLPPGRVQTNATQRDESRGLAGNVPSCSDRAEP